MTWGAFSTFARSCGATAELDWYRPAYSERRQMWWAQGRRRALYCARCAGTSTVAWWWTGAWSHSSNLGKRLDGTKLVVGERNRNKNDVKAAIAHAIGAKGTDLVITAGATESINLAFTVVAGLDPTTPHLLTLATEHAAVLSARRSNRLFRMILLGGGRCLSSHCFSALFFLGFPSGFLLCNLGFFGFVCVFLFVYNRVMSCSHNTNYRPQDRLKGNPASNKSSDNHEQSKSADTKTASNAARPAKV